MGKTAKRTPEVRSRKDKEFEMLLRRTVRFLRGRKQKEKRSRIRSFRPMP